MLGASKSGPFLGGIFLKPLINQLLLKVQLGDSDFLEAEEDLGEGANFLTYSHHGRALWLVVSADQHSTYHPLEH